jgi:hypothetical protein
VGCILLRNVHLRIFQTYTSNRNWEFFIDVIISLCITTCFGPYGPSSGEYNILFLFLKQLRESHRYHNGSVVHKDSYHISSWSLCLYLTYDPRRQYRRDYFETSPLCSMFRRSCHFIVVFLENKFLTLPLLPAKKDHTALLQRELPAVDVPRYSAYESVGCCMKWRAPFVLHAVFFRRSRVVIAPRPWTLAPFPVILCRVCTRWVQLGWLVCSCSCLLTRVFSEIASRNSVNCPQETLSNSFKFYFVLLLLFIILLVVLYGCETWSH